MGQNKQFDEKGSAGSLVSIIIVFAVIALGAYYFSKRVPTQTNTVAEQNVPEQDPMVTAFATQGSSDEIADIQKDIAATPNISLISTEFASSTKQ